MQELRMAVEKEQGIELDLEAFENEIGKEIDALFTPTGFADDAPEPAPKAPPEQFDFPMPKKLTVNEQPAAVQVPEASVLFDESLSIEGPFAAPPDAIAQPEPGFTLGPAADSFTPSIAEPAIEAAKADEIEKLVESFEIAYLSLDWDFSKGNVSGLAATLDKLEVHCRAKHETNSLYKILRAVLNHLASRPDGIPPEVNEVMRDAHNLLRQMLLSNGEIRTEEKQQLKSVITRVQAIKQKGVKKEEPQVETVEVTPPARFELPGADLRSSFDIKEMEDGDYYRLERLITWVDSSCEQLHAIHSELHEENVRLKRLEEVCEKKPALAPLANRIAAIHANIQQQINALWDRELEWQKSGDWLREMVARYASQQHVVAHADTPLVTLAFLEAKEPEPLAIKALEPVQQQLEPEEPARLFEEQVCAFSLSGKTYAVPTSNVIKVEPVNHKKYKKIMERGFATLNDFKPLFKSLKKGVFSAWQGLPSGILKSYQFVPIPLDTLQVAEPQTEVGGLILLSNGRHHAMIAMDSASVEQFSATIAESSKDGALFGTADDGLGKTAGLLNVEWILNELYGNETLGH
jgi:hypothetical protein